MTGYIYRVRNKINGKVYIGQTIQTVQKRWYRHCGKSGISKDELNTHFKRAILKYGKENFEVAILEECDRAKLNDRERYYIKLYNSYKEGYNSTLGGQDCGKPFKTNKETDDKIISKYQEGKSLRELGRLFNLDKYTIKYILTRNNIKLRTTRTYKLSQDDRADIIKDYNNGSTRKEIMLKYNISKSYLSQLISRNRRI